MSIQAICRICEDEIDPVQFPYHEFGVCSLCADTVANLYNFAHSGAYLTWPNHPRAQVYRKADISANLKALVWARDGCACLKCGARTDLSADHIVPESLGGQTVLENLQTICRSCNSRKGRRSNSSFMLEAG